MLYLWLIGGSANPNNAQIIFLKTLDIFANININFGLSKKLITFKVFHMYLFELN